MAALNLTDRAAVLAFLKLQLPDADEGVLEMLLDASAGLSCDDPAVTTFRPYWVLASQLSSRLDELKRARGASGAEVEYFGAESGIHGHLRTQQALDKSLCSVPLGFEATDPNAAGSSPLRRTYASHP